MKPLLDYIVTAPEVQIVFLVCFSLVVIVPYIVYSVRRHKYEDKVMGYQYAQDEHRRKMIEKGLIEQVSQ